MLLQLQKEIARIHESLSAVNVEFLDHKRAANSVHTKLQSQIGNAEVGRLSPQMQTASYNPDRGSGSQSQPRLGMQIDSSPSRGSATILARQGCAAAATEPSAQCTQVIAQPMVAGGGSGRYPQVVAPPTVTTSASLAPGMPCGGATYMHGMHGPQMTTLPQVPYR